MKRIILASIFVICIASTGWGETFTDPVSGITIHMGDPGNIQSYEVKRHRGQVDGHIKVDKVYQDYNYMFSDDPPPILVNDQDDYEFLQDYNYLFGDD